jgi:alkylhydroperoxidase family enzyme
MSERTRDQLARNNLTPHGNEPLAIFATLAHHPKLLASWLPFGGRLLEGGSLDRRFTELIILRTAYNTGNVYEWGQHVEISRARGIEQAAIERIAAGPEVDGWSPLEALLLRATDELHIKRYVTNATWEALAEHLDEARLIELCFLVGHYEMLAMFLRTVGVQLEPGKERLVLP